MPAIDCCCRRVCEYDDNMPDMDATPPPNSEEQSKHLQQTVAPERTVHWLTRHRVVISAVLGVVMLSMAVTAPLVAPIEQRGEVLIITILFGLASALLLYTAMDSNRGNAAERSRIRSSQQSMQSRNREQIKAQLQRKQASNIRRNRIAGFVFGLCFGLAGAIAPFALSEGSDNPDARFLMIIGFSPVAISGALMVILFGQTLWGEMPNGKTTGKATTSSRVSESKPDTLASNLAIVAVASGVLLSICAAVIPIIGSVAMNVGIGAPSAVMGGLGMALSLLGGSVMRRDHVQHLPASAEKPAPKTRRAPAPRIPGNCLYRIVAPVVIGLIFVLIIAVIAVVIAATITPLVQ